jgi:hypothetical protein
MLKVVEKGRMVAVAKVVTVAVRDRGKRRGLSKHIIRRLSSLMRSIPSSTLML